MAHTALRPDGYPRKSYKAMKPYREGQGGNDRLDMAHACCGKGRSSEEGRRPQFRLSSASVPPQGRLSDTQAVSGANTAECKAFTAVSAAVIHV